MFLELFDFELFFFIRNNFSEFYAFPEKTFGKTNSYRSFFFKKNPKRIYLASLYLLMS